MRYKHLKSADVDISEMTVGTWAIGGQNYGKVDRQDSIAAIRQMIECGVNVVDTAPCYGNGASEMIVGEALQGIRDRVLISTKCDLVTDIYTHGYVPNASYKNIMREIESSLTNMRTDHIDFYFLHYPDPSTPVEETMDAMNTLRRKGYIQFVGISNFSREQAEEAMQYGKIDVMQLPFSMVNQTSRELMEWGYSQGMDNFTYGSLGSGILTGAIRKNPNFASDDLRLNFYDFYKEPKFSRIMEMLKTNDRIAEAHKKPVSQVAINWSTQKEFVGTALCGVRNPREAIENCAAFDWELNADEIRMLDEELIRLEIG